MTIRVPLASVGLCGVLGLALVARPVAAQAWPDTVVGRLAAEAQLGELSFALLTHDSATLVLDDWCRRHGTDPHAQIVADRVRAAAKDPFPEIRAALRVGATETIAYRQVRLRCGTQILSEADNWYVPARLTPDINRALETTDIAFGRAALVLGFRRVGMSSRRLWSPLPPDWERLTEAKWPNGGMLAIPAFVLENRASLVVAGDLPISVVIERYTGAVLSLAPAVARPDPRRCSRRGQCRTAAGEVAAD